MKLDWTRTVIGRNEQRFDFIASFEGKHVGRIYRHMDPPLEGRWDWFLQAEDHATGRLGTRHSFASSKAEAADALLQAYITFMDWPAR